MTLSGAWGLPGNISLHSAHAAQANSLQKRGTHFHMPFYCSQTRPVLLSTCCCKIVHRPDSLDTMMRFLSQGQLPQQGE